MTTNSSDGDSSTNKPSPWIFGVAIGTVVALVIVVLFINVSIRYFSEYPRSEGWETHDPEATRGPNKTGSLDKVAARQLFLEYKSIIRDTALCQQSTNYTVCAICMEVLEDEEMVRPLVCGHIFHSGCITCWFLRLHDTCPLCKARFVNEDEIARTGRSSIENH
ncbi:uncharacterized protein VDAG_09149 [Verticillium dahliae VdLs.17]|uniref:RING-type domain-containing protein n=2 Tax=Verticillium TaxID=1036719 RepID=G2XFM5_VERDV|nr:uncharacterized protein VDAG_09149 [Verticillium dahliae VdLs.17]EGY18623.1 hypothetical protein VDAG_09149 [Verticillium dahliae VdLs.17]